MFLIAESNPFSVTKIQSESNPFVLAISEQNKPIESRDPYDSEVLERCN
jgi:hypothetical protein